MITNRSVGAYRRLVRVYPAAFRREFADDLVALFADQLADEPTIRVWMRATRDLSVTVPALHLEARMHRPSTNLVAIIASTISLVALFTIVVIGSSVTVLAPAALIAVASGSVAVWAWKADHTGRVARSGGLWWRVLASGAALLATVVVVTTITGELDTWGWLTAMALLLTSFVLMGLGVILGLVRLAGRKSRLAAG